MPDIVNTSFLRGHGLLDQVSVSLTGLSSVILTPDQLRHGMIEFTGSPTAAAVSVFFPAISGVAWMIINATDGASRVWCRVTGGTTSARAGLEVMAGRRAVVWSDGDQIRTAATAAGFGDGTPNQIIDISGSASYTLTPVQAANNFVTFTNLGVATDFDAIWPAGTLQIGELVMVGNETSNVANLRFTTSDIGIVLQGGRQVLLTVDHLGVFRRMGPDTDGTTFHFPQVAAFTTIAGTKQGIALRRRTRSISGDTTLAEADYQSPWINLTGALSGNATITFATAGAPEGGVWVLENSTTGGFSLVAKVQADAGAGVTIATARKATIGAGGTGGNAMQRLTPDVAVTP